MAIFVIGYDLHAGENYKDLTDAICRYGKPWHCLDFTWLIESNDTATIIKTNLMQHIKPDDRFASDALRKRSGSRNGC